MKRLRVGLLAAVISAALSFGAAAQSTPAATVNGSQAIATGLTYQTLLAAVAAPPATRRSLTIENNNTSDSCWIEVSGLVASGNTTSTSVTPPGQSATTALKASIALLPGGSYQRYFPYIPSGAIVGTCAATGDSIYVDTQ